MDMCIDAGVNDCIGIGLGDRMIVNDMDKIMIITTYQHASLIGSSWKKKLIQGTLTVR